MPDGAAASTKLGWIDALRGWAILLVMLTHAAQGRFAMLALDRFEPDAPTLALPPVLRAITTNAGYGVQLFFLASAFSLTLSDRARRASGGQDWLDYLVRRIARIGPGFWLAALGFTWVIGWGPRLWAPHGVDGLDMAATLLMLHVWLPDAENAVVPGGWSVGCEMSFYLVLPLLLRLMPDLRRAVIAGSLIMLAIMIGWPWLGIYADPFLFPLALPVFVCGIAACRLVQSPGFARVRRLPHAVVAWVAVMCFVVLICGLPQLHIANWRGARLLAFCAVATPFIVMLHAAPAGILVNHVTIAIGKVSYSMYLVHFALFRPAYAIAAWLMGAPQGRDDSMFLALYYVILVAATFPLAWLTFRLVEQPGIAAGRRLIAWRHAAAGG